MVLAVEVARVLIYFQGKTNRTDDKFDVGCKGKKALRITSKVFILSKVELPFYLAEKVDSLVLDVFHWLNIQK